MIRGYIGTYTHGDSKGIYSFELDTSAKKITNIKLAAELGNPTYLSITRDHRFLYSVVKEDGNGGLAAFSMDEKSGELKLLNSKLESGASPCYVSMDSEQKYLFGANYHKGTVESYLIDQNNNGIASVLSVVQHEGHGPDPRQEKAHTHYAEMTTDGKYLAVCELGCDMLFTYHVDENGQLSEVNRLSVKPGSGPRHLAFNPVDSSIAYVINELSSEIIVLSYKDGSFSEIQYISTIPDDFVENNQSSAIHVSSDGRFVYAGNRGHNSIAIFAVDFETRRLRFAERVSTEGDWPRDFSFDPTEKFAIASNQNSSNLVLFSRDTETGKLELLQKDVYVPNPVCIKF